MRRPPRAGRDGRARSSRLVALVVVSLTLAWNVLASSQRAPPLRRILAPLEPSIRILRHSLASSTLPLVELEPISSADILASDTLLVRFALDHQTPLSLLLHPSPNLIHPDARVHFHTLIDLTTGQTDVRTERLHRHHVRAYSGLVIPEWIIAQAWTDARTNPSSWIDWPIGTNWARLALRDGDGAWDGAFVFNGVVHHIRPIDTYLRTRLHADPDPPRMALLASPFDIGAHTIIMSDADLVPMSSYGVAPPSCAHDSLDFNVDPNRNPILVQGLSPTVPKSSLGHMPTWLDGLLDPQGSTGRGYWGSVPDLHRRQSGGGDVAGGMNMSTNFGASIGSTVGCPKEAQVVFIGVAAEYVNLHFAPLSIMARSHDVCFAPITVARIPIITAA